MQQTPTFSMIPTAEQLAGMNRQMKFFRTPVRAPRTLTAKQVRAFNEEGYLLGIRIFNEAEIAQHRNYFDRLLDEVTSAGKDSYSISSAHLYYAPVYDLLCHPRIVACVRDLLGENVIGWGSHYFCKMPHDGKQVAWHQDASYWPLSKSKTVTVWLAIDHADRENACVRFIPKSHLHGAIQYRPSLGQEHNVLDQTVENIEQYGQPVDVILKAGEISLHSDLLLHGSSANESSRRRCGLTLRYCTPDVKAHLDWHKKGVVVSGSDPSGNWANPGRPG